MSIRGVMIDMDGVLYHGTRPLEGAAEFLAWLPVPYVFVTNNSSRTPFEVATKLKTMRLPGHPEQILTSSLATTHYLKQHTPRGTRIFAIGESGLFEALREAGFEQSEKKPAYVVVGLDRAFDEEKSQKAVAAIRAGARFIATNMDKILMTENGSRPGTGTIVAQIAERSGVEALVMGKPEKQIFEMAAERLGFDLNELLMIGDNVETDIRGAQLHNIHAAFMLSGVSSEKDLAGLGYTPRFIAPNLPILQKQIANVLTY